MTSQKFDILYRKNYPVLYRLAFMILRDDEECRDLVNEVFADLLDGGRCDEIDNIDGYLFRTVRNRALSVISGRSVQERFCRLYPIEQELITSYDHNYDKKLFLIMQFLDSHLTPVARSVIRLIFEHGKSYKETAELEGISVPMVNKYVVKTLRMLREEFKKES
ncbi:MAG: sigma-70 family RNA polymerase sigma factor [Muribaculaceae bacterium]|nr:sigma-70 family RNA polymerase sigma factor [Muribaculaceae bacterium]